MSKDAPFDSTHADDMFISVRDELFIISALIEHAADCGNGNFVRTADEANAVLGEARTRLRDLTIQCGQAANYWGEVSLEKADAA